jgi:hypothetical protein
MEGIHMAGQESLVQDGVGRVNEAVDSITGELQRVRRELQRGLRTRRRDIEKQLRSGRREIERETRKQVRRLRGEWQKNPAVKRASRALSDAQKQVERRVEGLLSVVGVASRGDLERLDRKLAQINRKLRELEQVRRGNGTSASI